MREKKIHLYLDSKERSLLLHSLVELKNRLIQQDLRQIMKNINLLENGESPKPNILK